VDRPGCARRLEVLTVGYHYRRPPRQSRNPTLERALTLIVIAVLLGVLFLFLFVYHDVPLRTS
jgi:hypothetical protein